MKQIELITGLPDWRWKPNSEKELGLTDISSVVDESDFIWRIGNVAVAGFVYTSFVSPPWMWFVLADDVGFTDLLDFRRLASQITPGTLTVVAADFLVGLRFAKFYGFEETGDVVIHNLREYKFMRKI